MQEPQRLCFARPAMGIPVRSCVLHLAHLVFSQQVTLYRLAEFFRDRALKPVPFSPPRQGDLVGGDQLAVAD